MPFVDLKPVQGDNETGVNYERRVSAWRARRREAEAAEGWHLAFMLVLGALFAVLAVLLIVKSTYEFGGWPAVGWFAAGIGAFWLAVVGVHRWLVAPRGQ
jgi:ABC-type transport system involved in cytochrome bd biosynthesis fused ATPase/permease subunit